MRGWPLDAVEHRGRIAVRVAIGEQQDVREHLRAVADAVGAGVPQPARHPAEHERREPAEEGADRGERSTEAAAGSRTTRAPATAAAEDEHVERGAARA